MNQIIYLNILTMHGAYGVFCFIFVRDTKSNITSVQVVLVFLDI